MMYCYKLSEPKNKKPDLQLTINNTNYDIEFGCEILYR